MGKASRSMILLNEALAYVRERSDLVPQLGIVLGSGLGPVLEEVVDPVEIPYTKIPGFDDCTVAGHAGSLCLGLFEGVPVVCLKGRPHFYEGWGPDSFRLPIRLLKVLGASSVLMLNAAGSLNPEVAPGSFVLVNDHINLQPQNPLIGPNDDEIGPRFVSMDVVYDLALREQLLQSAQALGIGLKQGVYISVPGPSFETPAEIRAFRLLGADVIGMSTVPEVIVARHCGLCVALISVVSNMAAGLSDKPLTHELTLQGAALSLGDLKRLLGEWAAKFMGTT